MASGPSNLSIADLKSENFKPEYENIYRARNPSPKQSGKFAEAVMSAEHDRRHHVEKTQSDMWEYPGIGLLRVNFGGKIYTGTASLIIDGRFLLTCAHNVIDYDPIDRKFVWPTSAWFELRNGKERDAVEYRSAVYKAAVYPDYLKEPEPHSGFDLALCWIQEPDEVVKKLYSWYNEYMPRPLSGEYSTDAVAVVGFPTEHKGEKWGMVAEVPRSNKEDWKFSKNDQKKCLVYNFIDTSPGQSGSPVSGNGAKDVIGVHTGGSVNKNWATYLNPKKLEWIADRVGATIQKDSSNRLYLA